MKKVSKKTVLLIVVIILFLVALLEPLTGQAKMLSVRVAEYRASIALQQVSMPSGMEKIGDFSVRIIDNSACYQGEAYSFGATDLDIREVENFYHNYFTDKGWSVGTVDDPYFYFYSTEKRKTFTGRAVEGFDLKICNEECIAGIPDNSLKNLIIDTQKRFVSVYMLRTWFIPFEVRKNLCWCCSGG